MSNKADYIIEKIAAKKKKKENYAKQGAAIGVAGGAAEAVRETRVFRKGIAKPKAQAKIRSVMKNKNHSSHDTFKKMFKKGKGGAYKMSRTLKGGTAALAMAMGAGVGALIGKSAKKGDFKKKKGMKKQAAQKTSNRFGLNNKQRDFLAGTAAGAGATAVFYPLDAIVTSQQSGTWSKKSRVSPEARLRKGRNNNPKMKGLKHDLQKMSLPKKVKRLYKGVGLKLLKNAPTSGLTLALFGITQRYLQGKKTYKGGKF